MVGSRAESRGDETRYEARAVLGVLKAQNERVELIDSSIAEALVPVVASGIPLWVADHVSPDGEREVRVIRAAAGNRSVLARIRSPFTGGFGATVANRAVLLLVGPMFNSSGNGPVVVSLLLRARITCRSAPS